MNPSRIARWAVLAAFLVGTFSGPVLALCQMGAETAACCCTKDRQCPRPKTAEARRVACCKTTPPAVPAAPSGPDRAAVGLTPAAAIVTVAVMPPAAPISHPGDGVARRYDRVGLYTANEAFLI